MRPDAYVIIAAGRALYAPTPEELAEIAECALDAGDRIDLVCAERVGRLRPLRGHDLERFLDALAARPA